MDLKYKIIIVGIIIFTVVTLGAIHILDGDASKSTENSVNETDISLDDTKITRLSDNDTEGVRIISENGLQYEVIVGGDELLIGFDNMTNTDKVIIRSGMDTEEHVVKSSNNTVTVSQYPVSINVVVDGEEYTVETFGK